MGKNLKILKEQPIYLVILYLKYIKILFFGETNIEIGQAA